MSTYPTQVVRSRLQQRAEGRALVYRGSWQAVAVTWQREGVAGFYRGLPASLLRVMPQSAITLAVYEGVVKLLERGAPDGEPQQQQPQREGGRQQPGGGGGPLRNLRQRLRWRSAPLLTDGMSPLEIAADAQAEQ